MVGAAALALAVAGKPAGGQAAPESVAAFGDSYTEAAGLRPLRVELLPRGTREIRVWVGGGLGWPQELFRLVERGGQSSGEFFIDWGIY